MYKDGTWDAGSFMVGHENLGYAILMNEKVRYAPPRTSKGDGSQDGSYFLNPPISFEGEEKWSSYRIPGE